MAAALVVVAMVIIVAGLGTVFESQGPPVTSTQSTSAIPVPCVFSGTSLTVTAPTSASFTGCLTPGTSGDYVLSVTDQAGLTLTGNITSIYPMGVEVNGSSFYQSAHIAATSVYSANETESVSLPAIDLQPSYNYAIIVQNQAVQNNTVTISIDLENSTGSSGA